MHWGVYFIVITSFPRSSGECVYGQIWSIRAWARFQQYSYLLLWNGLWSLISSAGYHCTSASRLFFLNWKVSKERVYVLVNANSCGDWFMYIWWNGLFWRSWMLSYDYFVLYNKIPLNAKMEQIFVTMCNLGFILYIWSLCSQNNREREAKHYETRYRELWVTITQPWKHGLTVWVGSVWGFIGSVKFEPLSV